MHPERVVRAALALAQAGATATDVSKRLSVPRRTVAAWIEGDLPHSARADSCGQCHQVHEFADLSPGYVYLPWLVSRRRLPLETSERRLQASDLPRCQIPRHHRVRRRRDRRGERRSRSDPCTAAELRRGLLVLETLAVPISATWSGEARAAHRADRLAADAGRPLAQAAAPRADPLRWLPVSEHGPELVVAALRLQTGIHRHQSDLLRRLRPGRAALD